MNYMEEGIVFEAKMGDGSEPDKGFFGGEGAFLATLRGHGTVILQSMPFSWMADRILSHAPSAGGARKGEGSVLGGLGDLLDGD